MAHIDSSTLRNWNDGDIMHEADYEQEREIIRVAINDNDDRIRVLESANLGVMTGIRSGISFPSSPTPKTGDLFFRTDEGKLYVFDATSTWSNDPSKVMAWAKGYGLGDVAKDISGTDVNTLDGSGFYKGNNLTNAPQVNANYVWDIIHRKISLTGASQMATLVTDQNGNLFNGVVSVRQKAAGVWGVWQSIGTFQETWTALTLINSWVSYGNGYANPAYRKNNFAEVELRGVIKSGVTTIGTVIATLPTGYRPQTSKSYSVASYDGTNSVVGRISVGTDGTIMFYGGSNVFLSLDNIVIPTT
jgi:hypothetical protein